MPKVVLYIATTLDGYIASSDGGVDWLTPFEKSGEDYGYEAFAATVSTVIMGGKTYRHLLPLLPPGGWAYPGMKSYILTRQGQAALQPPQGADIEAYHGDLVALVKKVKAETARDVFLVGGGEIIRAFAAENLIDEMILFIMPVMLGDGIQLFPVGQASTRTPKLLTSKDYPSGVVMLHYAFS